MPITAASTTSGCSNSTAFDLHAVHVLAAPDHHVLGAVDDVHEALVVDAGEVAALQPAVAEGLPRSRPACPSSPSRRSGPGSTARRPRRRGTSLPSASTTRTSTHRHGHADAVGLALVVDARVHRRDRRRLGQAVAVRRRAAREQLVDPAHELGRGAARRRSRSTARSRCRAIANDGDCSTCHTIAGTPPKVVTRSRSISSSARSASHLCISTSLPPAASVRDQHGVTAGRVEERHRQQVRRSGPGSAPAACPAAHLRAPRRERERDEVAADVAVRAQRALGRPVVPDV